MRTHKPNTRPKNLDCAYCDWLTDRGWQDKPHYPVPTGTSKPLIRIAHLHRAVEVSTTYAGNPNWGCWTCGGKWPCNTVDAVVEAIHEKPAITDTPEGMERAFGVIGGDGNLI